MIIIDGCDGAGKTTLCEMLLNHGIVDRILPSPKVVAKGNLEKMKYEVDRYLRLYGTDNRVAVDRYLFSEMAYGPIFRGRSIFTRGEYMTKLLEILLSGSITIFCFPDTLHYKENESPYLLEKMPLVRKAYDALAEDSAFSNHKTYIYRWNELNAFENLKQFIKENQ